MFPTRAGRAEKVQKATLILIYLAIMSHCALEAAASRQGHAHHITETVNGIDNGTGRTGMLNEHLAAAWSQDVSETRNPRASIQARGQTIWRTITEDMVYPELTIRESEFPFPSVVNAETVEQ